MNRTGHYQNGKFIPGPNQGLVHLRSGNGPARPSFSERDNIKGLRVTLNLLGDGYVEAVPDETLKSIAQRQRAITSGRIHGQVLEVSALESRNSEMHVGRFGWKCQHASLLSASADALRNELGVPNILYPQPLMREGGEVYKATDLKPTTQETPNVMASHSDLEEILRFVRSSEPIARDSDTADTPVVKAGEHIFEKIGCAICHVSTLKTASAGTVLFGTATSKASSVGEYKIPAKLGSKIIHPYSDYLLHDVSTGDGIVQTASLTGIDMSPAAQETANKFRTAPLWGVRFRTWMMHDGQAKTYHQAIMRHAGEAEGVIKNYEALAPIERHQLQAFLDSL